MTESYLNNFTVDTFMNEDDWAYTELNCLIDGCLWDSYIDGDTLPEIISEATEHYKEAHDETV